MYIVVVSPSLAWPVSACMTLQMNTSTFWKCSTFTPTSMHTRFTMTHRECIAIALFLSSLCAYRKMTFTKGGIGAGIQ